MAYLYLLSILLALNTLVYCASAAVHGHNLENMERESDGRFRGRDFDHYGDSGHNADFDHEAILGSVKEAERFESLSPEEARDKLAELLVKMDENKDNHVDRTELKKWILKSFRALSLEEAEERLQEADEDQDGAVTWPEYLRLFGFDSEDDPNDDVSDSGMSLKDEKAMFAVADANGDGKLELDEFEVFTNPEEHEVMHQFLINQTLRERDSNRDGRIDFQEYLGERGSQQDKEWVLTEKDKFENDLDRNNDGHIDRQEIHAWVIPDNEEIALEEVSHLFHSVDDNQDDVLSFDEVLDHTDLFVGNAGRHGSDMYGEHFEDEL